MYNVFFLYVMKSSSVDLVIPTWLNFVISSAVFARRCRRPRSGLRCRAGPPTLRSQSLTRGFEHFACDSRVSTQAPQSPRTTYSSASHTMRFSITAIYYPISPSPHPSPSARLPCVSLLSVRVPVCVSLRCRPALQHRRRRRTSKAATHYNCSLDHCGPSCRFHYHCFPLRRASDRKGAQL